MTKGELIKALQESELSDDAPIMLSGDSEGSFFEDGFYAEEMVYWDGSIYYRKLTDELRKQGYSEEDICEYDGEDVIILWP